MGSKSKLPAFFVWFWIVQIFGTQLGDCSLTCGKSVDLVLVAEDSSLLDPNSVSAVQNFLAYIAKRFIINQYDSSRIAFVLYNSDPRTIFNLNDKQTTTDVIAAILASDFKRDPGTPNITKAFEHTYGEVLRVQNGERSCLPTVVILLSYSSSVPNGLYAPPYDNVPAEIAAAREIQNAAGLVLTVGIGSERDADTLMKIANNDQSNYFDFSDFTPSKLSDAHAGPIADAACNYVSTDPLLPYPSVMEQVKVDVTFVVDISQLSANMANAINSYFTRFLTPYGSSFGRNGVQASLVTYSQTADIPIFFKTYSKIADFLNFARSSLDPPTPINDRNIYNALEQINNHLFVESTGYRPDVPQEIFIFSSACYTGPDPTTLAQQLRTRAGIHLITMGPSAGFWKEALDIVDEPENFYYIAENPDIVIPSFFPYRSWIILGKHSAWIPPTEAPPPATTTAIPGIDACADLVFILDESEVLFKTNSESNEWNTAFETVKQFIIDFSKQFAIGQDHTRVSVIGFGTQAQVQFALTDSTDQSSLDIKVKELNLVSGARNAVSGFLTAYDQINQNKRANVPVYAVFISVDADDVNAPGDVTTAAAKLSQLGVNLYLIPMKNFYPESKSFPAQITNIQNAYQGSKVYQMQTYKDLSSNAFAGDLLNAIKKDAMCAAPKSVDDQAQTTPSTHNLQAPWTCKSGSGYKADIALIVDQSTSIPAELYNNQVQLYLKTLVDNFDITASTSHLAMLRFCDPTKEADEVVFNFKATQDKGQLETQIKNNVYCGGSTSLEYAMNYTLTTLFTPDQGARPLDPKTSRIAIIITDGLATDAQDPSNIPAAKALVKANIQVFAVGMGPLKSPTYLQMLTGQPDASYVFYIDDFQSLSDKVKALVCKGG